MPLEKLKLAKKKKTQSNNWHKTYTQHNPDRNNSSQVKLHFFIWNCITMQCRNKAITEQFSLRESAWEILLDENCWYNSDSLQLLWKVYKKLARSK